MNHIPSSHSKTLRVPVIPILTGAPALAALGPRPPYTTALAPLSRTGSRIGRLRSRGGRPRRQGRAHSPGRGATSRAAARDGRVEERPRLAGRKLDTVGAGRVGDVAAAVRDPGDGRPGAAVCGLDVGLLPGRGLGRVLRGAAVGLQPLVAQLAAERDGQHVVGRAVDPEVRNWGGAAGAAGELGAGDDRHGFEDVCV